MLARRQEILMAMAAVLAEKGYEATTLDDVATRMNSSRAVIYYQFRSKEELYVQLVGQVLETAAGRLAEIIARGGSPATQLRSAVADLVEMGFLPLHYAALRTGRPSSLSKESRSYLRALDREYERMFMDIVQRGMDYGVVVRRDPRLVAYTLINAAHSVFRWFRPGERLSPQLLTKEVPEMLLEGVLTR
jgi:AcrR family transcriptional regulator